MKRLLQSRFVDRALAGASLVVTDRRWAAPLSAAALGFGIFAGVAIGPGAAGTLATGAQQVIELPGSNEADGQSGGGGGGTASTESAPPPLGGESGGLEEPLATAPIASEPLEPPPAPESPPAPPPAEPQPEEAEEPQGEAFKGTVAQLNPAAGSFALALAGGEVVAVHATELPDPGTKLTAQLERLANGTFAEAEVPEFGKGRASQVVLRGVVTFADPDPAAPAYTLSGRGASLLVHVDLDPSGAVPQLPAVGAYAAVTARISSGLWQESIEIEPGEPSTYLELAGIVKEVLPDGHILFSADWAGEGESTLTLSIPQEVDASRLKAGDSYLATVSVESDSSLKLSGITSDEHTKGADEPSSAQGDLKRARASASSAGGAVAGVPHSGGRRKAASEHMGEGRRDRTRG
jgi:hypothetical protein